MEQYERWYYLAHNVTYKTDANNEIRMNLEIFLNTLLLFLCEILS